MYLDLDWDLDMDLDLDLDLNQIIAMVEGLKGRSIKSSKHGGRNSLSNTTPPMGPPPQVPHGGCP